MAIQLKTSLPGPRSQTLMKERLEAVARGPFHTTPLFAARAKGSLVEDVDGNTLIDFTSGIGVVNSGHVAEAVVKRVQQQAEKFLHTSFNVVAYESYIRVCEKLNAALPGNFKKKSFLANSGAEAVENAIKIARAYTGRPAVVCFEHAYHGRTYLAMTLTAKVKPYKWGFAPFNSDVYRAPAPYPYRWPTGSDETKVSNECFAAFTDLVNSQIGAEQVAAVIIEPVMGEGGFIPMPALFAKKLREFCTAKKIVLIFDEVQSGFGRTGTMFACEQLGVEPDLVTTAKGLGGGMPISAVTGRAEIMDAPIDGAIGGTFNGNPVSCEAALGVFETIEKGGLLQSSKRVGTKIQAQLRAWKEQFPYVGDVRWLGTMAGMELVKDRTTKEPWADAAKTLQKKCYEKGLLIMTAGTYGNVVRLLPPLTIDDATLAEGFAVLEGQMKALL